MSNENITSGINHKQIIARKFVLYLLISSALISVFVVTLQTYYEYDTQLANIESRFDDIESANRESVINALWIADSQQINIILRGITQLPSIKYVTISEGPEIIYSSGNAPALNNSESNNLIVRSHSLYKYYQDKRIKLGEMHITASLDEVYENLITIGTKTFYHELTQMFIITALIFIIFYKLVGRHLEKMAQYARSLNLQELDTPLELDGYDRMQKEADELSHLVNAINDMRLNLKSSNQEKNALIQSLASSETKFRGVFESSADGVLLVNHKGMIEMANATLQNMSGFTEKELIGHPVETLVPKRFTQHEQLRQHYSNKPARRQMGGNMVLTLRCKDESEVPVEISLTPVKTDDGTIFAAMLQDISQRRQAEQEKEKLLQSLESKNAELERFTYTASHDLKSPLVTISGFIGLLRNDIADGHNERIATDLNRISDAAKTMQQLLDDLLALSRIGRATVPHTKVPLNTLINNVLEMLTGVIDSTGARISVEENLPTVIVEEQRFKEVFLNLIENGIKYHQSNVKPEISIGIHNNNSDGNGLITLYVRDNGIGIKSCYYHKIFGLFDRLDHGTEGSGIGLSIVKRIIEVHGGSIWVESEGLNHGSTFYFSIPDNN